MTNNWLRKYGVMEGTKAEDGVDEDLDRKKLTPYFASEPDMLDKRGVRAVFLGYYFEWDPKNSFEVAREHGFESSVDGCKTGLYNYADIDDSFISIHHFLKWYKFGFPRLFDNLSLEIRNERLTRKEALEIIKNIGPQIPYEDINSFCEFTGLSEARFYKILEKFRNRNIWLFRKNFWIVKNFIVQDWESWAEFSVISSWYSDEKEC